jgi:hypothetical protein
MKKLTLFICFILICFGTKVFAQAEDHCYIRTVDKVYFGKDIKLGLLHTRVVLPDETFAEFRNRDIIAYRNHEKLYMLMPVICNKSDTLCMAMMEYVTKKSGCMVFRYCCSDLPNELDKLVDAKKNYFFIYKEGKFYRRISEDETEALAAFGIKVI